MRNEVIKFKDVKTIEQVNIISDRTYQRADYLKSVMYSLRKPKKIRAKAFLLWQRNYKILLKFAEIYWHETQHQNEEFASGGIVIGEVHQNEFIINLKHDK